MTWSLTPYNGPADEWEFSLAQPSDTSELGDKEQAQVQAVQDLSHRLIASADQGEAVSLQATGSDVGLELRFQYLAASSPEGEPAASPAPTPPPQVQPDPAAQTPPAPPQ